ncbi:hypothetical protein CFAM422_009629 [Trichoderma lentiforme]|uniref:Uncharacterized protein n=1 Tax=Trichoderma lentiforme TaxID=1567552 RepID=A0A9P4X7F9_9HYPO|nr:hypothetical protein CFAM422_009629 [Trichoderma lentiforme]
MAQQSFKARRLAAQAETENRIAHLEKTIESMVELFLKMTDTVMSFASVRQHPDLSRHIRDSISQCLSLVRGSTTVDREGDKSEKTCTDLVSSQTQVTSHHVAVPSTARSDQIAMMSDFYAPFLPEPVLGGCLDAGHTLSPGVSNPFDPSRSYEFIRLYSKYSRSFASIELIRYTLNVAYNVLHNAVDLSTGLVAQMFGSSLQSHSKEQLLSKLLWTLGPGSSILGEFASIDTTISSPESEASQQIPALDIVSYDSDSSLINAEGVVRWLDSIGVRRIDEDTLEVPMWDQATPPDVGGVVPRRLQGRYSFLNGDVFFSPTRSTTRREKGGLTKGSKRSTAACTTRISQSALFRSLSEVSVCLDTGVAYHRQHLVKLVMASQVC